MSEPTREEVQHFLKALQYGMKVTHKPEFLMALAEGWLHNNSVQTEVMRPTRSRQEMAYCDHQWEPVSESWKECTQCGKEEPRD